MRDFRDMIFILKNISIPRDGISWEVNETATTKKKSILIRVRRKIKERKYSFSRV